MYNVVYYHRNFEVVFFVYVMKEEFVYIYILQAKIHKNKMTIKLLKKLHIFVLVFVSCCVIHNDTKYWPIKASGHFCTKAVLHCKIVRTHDASGHVLHVFDRGQFRHVVFYRTHSERVPNRTTRKLDNQTCVCVCVQSMP